jgi:hypothetical protein
VIETRRREAVVLDQIASEGVDVLPITDNASLIAASDHVIAV